MIFSFLLHVLRWKNIYVEDVKPGQIYSSVIDKSITPLLRSLFESSVVTAMVHYTIDEALASVSRIPNHVKGLLQQKLNTIESGIKVSSVELTKTEWPRQVEKAFQNSISTRQTTEMAVRKAKTYADWKFAHTKKKSKKKSKKTI